ncbi:hypothetical protein D3C76_1526570 [compost metagenome]
MGDSATCCSQWRLGLQQAKALLQLLQALPALVIELICHQRDALAMVVIIPLGNSVAQLGNLGVSLFHGPVGARVGPCQRGL